MFSALALAAVLAPDRPEVFFAYGDYDSSVPRPSKILGYEIGERHTTYFGQQQVLDAIVKGAPNRTRYYVYGKTAEGRPLRVVAISSAENISRLPEIMAGNKKLADGLNDPAVIKSNPTIVWINQTIHGDEAASFESGMHLIYNLAASKNRAVTDMLKQVIVVVNPCYNPDGHERYVVWQNSIAIGSPDPGAMEHAQPRSVNGRVNHYRFDLNRDRVSLSQLESREEALFVRKWNPQTYVDQHGEVETYFFPPTAMSNHALIDRERYIKWTDTYGRATAKAFDKHAWGYYIKETFDMYYPGYLDSFATLNGAIGMTHETDAAELARLDNDGVQRTLWGGAAKHFTSAMAVIKTAAENRQSLLESYASFRANAASGKHAGAQRYLVAYSASEEKINALRLNLGYAGIDSKTGYGSINVDGESLWNEEDKFSGQGYWLTLDLAQPQGILAKALLSTENAFEDEFIKEQLRRKEDGEGSEFYDMTGWSLPLLHDVQAWWVKSAPEPNRLEPPRRKTQMGEIGYAIDPGERGTLLAIRLLAKGVRISFSDKPMKLAGRDFEAGTFLVLKGRNNDDLKKVVESLDIDGEAYPLPTAYPDETRYGPGSEGVMRLKPSSIAVLFGDDANPTPFGSVWYTLEQRFRLPFTPITRNGLRGKLERFSAILAPGGRIEVSDAIKEWISEGGCLILLGGSPGTGGFIDLRSESSTPIPGVVAKAKIDRKSWLGYGSEDDTVAVPMDGGSFIKGEDSAIEVVKSKRSILHGWAWPDETEKDISGAAFAHVESVGNGHVVWFANDPTDRAMWPGLHLFLLNAIAYGPRS